MSEIVLCSCPQTGALMSIPLADCPFNLEQTQKLAFQKDGQSYTDEQMKLLATFTPLLIAEDATKMVVTPFIGANPIITAGTPITTGGGDNSTLNGEEVVLGSNPSLFTTDFTGITPEQEKALKYLKCIKKLRVFFINQNDEIIAEKFTDGENVKYRGILISAYFFSDRTNNGFGTQDVNSMRFSLKAGWSENIVKIKPTDFSPLLDLEA